MKPSALLGILAGLVVGASVGIVIIAVERHWYWMAAFFGLVAAVLTAAVVLSF